MKPLIAYLIRTCKDWNEGGCSKRGKDSNHCGFGASALCHGCSRIVGQYSICWKNHKEAEHV